ncbi:MAG: aminotransferase class V-fold PLP-dependent enzyme [Planctomycetaceae bacterium]|nr:aminotransferase class V-fold PLP-dependent enzyme [Planctomycetaceae bacterium]
MWARKRIDIGWSDLAFGAVCCLVPGRRTAAVADAEAAWISDGSALACLSVRSGLDLLLQTMNWPSGSEILMSAVNIGGMVQVVEHHQLKIVAVDLRTDDASVDCAQLESLVTPQTRAILVAHLLGVVADVTPICDFARRHSLMVIEDCAQAYAGTAYRGHEQADVSMFSFGPIKTATALGGALLRVRSNSVRNQMRQLQGTYPVQSRWRFLKRIGFYSLLRFLGQKRVFAAFVWCCIRLGKDLEKFLNGSVRNFPGGQFIASLRQQPCGPLLRLMARRVRRYPDRLIERRAALGRMLTQELSLCRCPGGAAKFHSYWLAMVQVQHPDTTLKELRRHGFDATSSNALRPVSESVPESTAVARAMLANTVYLPIYAEMPASEVRRMVACLLTVEQHAQTSAAGRTQ